MPEEKIDDALKDVLKGILDDFSNADKFIHEQIAKVCKRNNEYWHGLQNLFWSETTNDWSSPGQADLDFLADENMGTNEGFPLYDYVIDIYKAHGESVIAALSQQVPPVDFPPDDVDSPEDQTTSKAFDKISTLIQKHNRTKKLFARFFHILWNQGLLFVHTYSKEDKKFGTILVDDYNNKKVRDPDLYFCSTCRDSVETPNELGVSHCDRCMADNVPLMQEGKEREVPVVVGQHEQPKSRTFIESWGPLNVRVPYYAKCQADCHYLIHSFEQHFSLARMENPHIADKIAPGMGAKGSYLRWARSPDTYATAYKGDENPEYITVGKMWLRRSAYWRLSDQQDPENKFRKELLDKFPEGLVATFVGDIFSKVEPADLDDDWTISESPVSEYIYADPMGQPIIPVQDMENTVANLTIDTIEHGVPDRFYDPEIVDPNLYKSHESQPGLSYPMKNPIRDAPANHFFTWPAATLSKEVMPFEQELQKKAQFLVGSFPSIYGGPGEGNSRTFSEYNMSRSMALQRLNLVWGMVIDLWARTIDKAVRKYAKAMLTDEYYSQKKNGSFLKIWIKKAELEGKVGEVEPEASNVFPISSEQKADKLMKLFELKVPEINMALLHPENRKNLSEALSFPDLYIPGDDQVKKAYRYIEKLIHDADRIAESGGMMEPDNPSIPIDMDVDDAALFIQVFKDFLVSERGLDLYEQNPQAYANVRAAMKQYELSLEMKTFSRHQDTPIGVPPKTEMNE